jgi:hypothetical protein
MPPSCTICSMMYDAYVMQNDVMMLCYVWWYSFRRYTHIRAIKYIIFFESALIFRYKPPLGASSPFTSAESALTFCCKLCIPLGTTLEQKTYTALLLERLFIASNKFNNPKILLVIANSQASVT